MESSQQTVDSKTLADLETKLEAHIDRVTDKEGTTKADLEEFRKKLPTDHMLAKAVQMALPFPWSELFEYVEATDHRRAHWRTSHDRTAIRSPADREHKERFAKAAREARGLKGTIEHDGKEIPASAAHVTDTLSAETSKSDHMPDIGRRALRRLHELIGDRR